MSLIAFEPSFYDIHLLARKVEVSSPEGQESGAWAMLDTGSTCSFILRELAESLNLPKIRTKTILLSRFNDEGKPEELKCYESIIKLRQVDGNFTNISVNVVDDILPSSNLFSLEDYEVKQAKRGLIIPEATKARPQILIGIDNFRALRFTCDGSLPNGLSVYQTNFGPFVGGKSKKGFHAKGPKQAKAIAAACILQLKQMDEEEYPLRSKAIESWKRFTEAPEPKRNLQETSKVLQSTDQVGIVTQGIVQTPENESATKFDEQQASPRPEKSCILEAVQAWKQANPEAITSAIKATAQSWKKLEPPNSSRNDDREAYEALKNLYHWQRRARGVT
jgi:hypothetical protein